MGYTKGPWEVVKEPNDACCHVCGISAIDADGLALTHVADIANRRDAHLIASAPELLEACKEALQCLKDLSKDKICSMQGQISILEQAIAKAEGE